MHLIGLLLVAVGLQVPRVLWVLEKKGPVEDGSRAKSCGKGEKRVAQVGNG